MYRYLCQTFGEEETLRLFQLYRIGTSSKWGGATIFWQTDRQGQVRTGKIMLYDPATGHRIKEPRAYVSWVHSELHLPDFRLRQCLFGEHLLNRSTSAPVMLVESEKDSRRHDATSYRITFGWQRAGRMATSTGRQCPFFGTGR